jgi:hypothetical protein
VAAREPKSYQPDEKKKSQEKLPKKDGINVKDKPD